ncbi:MAG: hypothetical protein GZ093_14690 [Rhodoferax sp.]|uniref:hypothetical protein n=1 Tax=Rhodoferax sp. TaxID=50421 RepID=UPI0013FF184D|nr:hypothetical protein [Rhodoferax sp.]NDP39973.1 hypothetical protein [Rhodoferax sp.]
MSIFNWFSKKRSATAALEAAGPEPGSVDATAPSAASRDTSRKTARLELRQLLYSVVRDSMISAGVLAASYRFKVLSLDAAGRQYLVMMDLADRVASDTARLAEIEDLMVQSAKMRHDILVKAVYWRVNDHVSTGLPSSQATPLSPTSRAASESKTARPSEGPTMAHNQAPHYEPLQQDEVAAFKRALASASASVPLSASGKIVTSGRRNPAPPEEFEDTQMADPDERPSPLGVTQYGDLS